MSAGLSTLWQALDQATLRRFEGRVLQAVGPLLEAELPGARVGATCMIDDRCRAEVVGFRERRALLIPLDVTEGIAYGSVVRSTGESLSVAVGDALLGRVIDGLGEPLDGKGPIKARNRRRVQASASNPLSRDLIEAPMHTGLRVVDTFTPVGLGQRMCVIAGSGVGKSTLMGAVAKGAEAELNVICLIGERGREVREFVEHNLGPEGLARSVVVAVVSDKSPAQIVKGAYLATAIAEHFREEGKHVLLMMDSLTRFAQAQRQIGLSAGEPPTTKGYTPSVFSELPKLLERAGPGQHGGSITGLYTVLVEGDDIHDPIADAVRGIVDGHLVLSRKLASHGHYPAVDVLGSLSRLSDVISTPENLEASRRLRAVMATWAENEELIRLGAYRRGSAPEIDQAIAMMPKINRFLRQNTGEKIGSARWQQELTTLLGELDAPRQRKRS